MVHIGAAPEEVQFVEKDERRTGSTRFAEGDFVAKGDPIAGGDDIQ